jgi:hypothetical protein
MPFNSTVARQKHTHEHIARMESDKVICMSGGDAYSGGTFSHSTADKERWNGYEEIGDSGVDRGWMPQQRITEAAQKASKAADAPWIAAGAADERNRLGPLKPHDVLVTARGDITPIPPAFEDTGHGAGALYPGPYTNDGLVAQTNSLDYGSFSLPERNGLSSTGLIVPERLSTRPGRAPRPGPDSPARWQGPDWVHPAPGQDDHVASWATPAYKASPAGKHPGNPIWKSISTSLSDWRGEDNGMMSPPVEKPTMPFKLGVTRKGGATGQGYGKGTFFASQVGAARGGPGNTSSHSSGGSRSSSRRGENRSASADMAGRFSGRSSELSYGTSSSSVGRHDATLSKSQMSASQHFSRPGLRMSY